jgi:tetrahydromethanopterin S-methyltransferase subunit F
MTNTTKKSGSQILSISVANTTTKELAWGFEILLVLLLILALLAMKL